MIEQRGVVDESSPSKDIALEDSLPGNGMVMQNASVGETKARKQVVVEVPNIKDIIRREMAVTGKRAEKRVTEADQKRKEGTQARNGKPQQAKASESATGSSDNGNRLRQEKEKAEQEVVPNFREQFKEVRTTPIPAIPSSPAKPPYVADKRSTSTQKSEMKANALSKKDLASMPVQKLAEMVERGEVTMSLKDLQDVCPKLMTTLNRRYKNRRVRVTPKRPGRDEQNQALATLDNYQDRAGYVNIDDLYAGDLERCLMVEENGVPAGTIVHQDIVECFEMDVPPHDREHITLVANVSEGLRCVFPIINGMAEQVECIVDSGSQIISMNKDVATRLKLSWSPDTTINMQSANGELAPTKGVVRNVPFRFGEVTVFLQVHVVDGAPYQVLMGRPFDTLSKSIVTNFEDGMQEMTITCPNTGKRAIVATYPRGTRFRTQADVERDTHPPPISVPKSEMGNVNFTPSKI